MSKLLVLDNEQINKKIKRLSYEVLEANYDVKKLYLVGINNNGFELAKIFKRELKKISDQEILLTRIKLNPANPTEDISLSIDISEFQKQNVIIVDDVANTGRTIFYACKPFLEVLPKSIQVAVMVDRKHKVFPIQVDFVGISLATTFQENIQVELGKDKKVVLE